MDDATPKSPALPDNCEDIPSIIVSESSLPALDMMSPMLDSIENDNTNDNGVASSSAANAVIEDGDASTNNHNEKLSVQRGGGGGILSPSSSTSPSHHLLPAAAVSSSSRTSLSLAADLSSYFATLSKTISRLHNIATDTTHAVSSAAADGAMADIKSSSVAMLLWEGVGPILAAGHSCDMGGIADGMLAFEYSSKNGYVGDDGQLITPHQAALYLFAVAQNIVAFESAVLGTFSNINATTPATADSIMRRGTVSFNNAHGNTSMGGAKSITANQVAEIVSAATVAATYCTSRSIISQSGILPALAHLIESTGNIPPSKFGRSCLHSITPFHPEFLQVSLLAGQYRYASSFLSHHPTSTATLDFPFLPIDPSCYLRTHYQAGLVHMKCNDWNAALDSFHHCLTMPCSTVSKIAIAARKKSLLVQCLLLESDELDGTTSISTTSTNLVVRAGSSTTVPKKSAQSIKSKVEKKVLDLPGAASAAVCKYMSASLNRVEGGSGGGSGEERGVEDVGGREGFGGSAPERTGAVSSEPSKQSSFRKDRSSRRRTRGGSSSNSLLEETRSDRECGHQEGGSSSKKFSHLGCYHDLVSTYISGNACHFAKLLSEMTDLLHLDGNWELAKQLEGRLLVYRSICGIASVYSVLGLDALEVKMQNTGSGAEVVGNRSLEDLVMGMAACDAKNPLIVDPFFARIDQSTGMVAFLDDDDQAVDDWLDADLSTRLQSCMALAERVRDIDIALTTSPKYLQHSVKEKVRSDLSASSVTMRQQRGSVGDFSHGAMGVGMDES